MRLHPSVGLAEQFLALLAADEAAELATDRGCERAMPVVSKRAAASVRSSTARLVAGGLGQDASHQAGRRERPGSSFGLEPLCVGEPPPRWSGAGRASRTAAARARRRSWCIATRMNCTWSSNGSARAGRSPRSARRRSRRCRYRARSGRSPRPGRCAGRDSPHRTSAPWRSQPPRTSRLVVGEPDDREQIRAQVHHAVAVTPVVGVGEELRPAAPRDRPIPPGGSTPTARRHARYVAPSSRPCNGHAESPQPHRNERGPSTRAPGGRQRNRGRRLPWRLRRVGRPRARSSAAWRSRAVRLLPRSPADALFAAYIASECAIRYPSRGGAPSRRRRHLKFGPANPVDDDQAGRR